MRGMKTISAVLVLGLLVLSAFAALPVSAQPKKGPALDRIIVETRATGEVAVGDVATGKLDLYEKSLSPTVYAGIPEDWKQNLKLIKNAGGCWELTLNPVHDEDKAYIVTVMGKEYFNPFAIRKIRFAMNYLINRKYLVDEILLGGGQPMFSAVFPSNPASKYFTDIYEKYGLTPEGNEELALQMVEEAMQKAAAELGGRLEKRKDPNAPAGFWWYFDGEPVTVKAYIRIEDERHEQGLYFANQLEKTGIKVERIEGNFLKCIYTVYLSNPADYEWNIYTAGWGSTGSSVFVEGDIAWYYAPWYGWMPAYAMPGWWEWQNETIDKLTMDLLLGNFNTRDEYFDWMRKACEIGLQESIRVFTVETWDYFPVNKQRVTRIAYDPVTGLWSKWPLITADTPDHVLRIAVESQQAAMYTSVFNPIGGFDDVYSHAVGRACYDEADQMNPMTGEPIPYRVRWVDIEKKYHMENGERVGDLEVPLQAVIYDPVANEWKRVEEGTKAVVRATIDYLFSKYHDGTMGSMDDVRYAIAHAYEWSSLDEEGDPYYSEEYASSVAPVLELIKGFVFVDEDTIMVYGDYLHLASDNATFDFYVFGFAYPWHVWEAMDWIIVHGGPVSGNAYDWYKVEGKEYLDMISPAHTEDLVAAVAEMRNRGHVPDCLKDTVTVVKARARYTAAELFAKKYGHFFISDGPFFLKEYNTQVPYMILEAFRDETYPFGPDYWYNKFTLIREKIDKIEAPATVQAGNDITVKIYVTEVEEFPEEKQVPSEKAYVYVTLESPEGKKVFEGVASLVSPGVFQVEIPGSATAGQPEGSYTIRASAAVSETAAYAEISTQEIILTAPPVTETPTPTPTATPTPSPSPTPTPSPSPTPTPSPSPTPKPTNWALIGGVIVIIIIIAVVVLFVMRRK